MKKKFLILGVVILVLTAIFAINVSAYEITSAEITMTPSKTECNPGDTVDFTVNLKNLNADTGLIGFGAYVEYDSNLLALNTDAEGLSGWSDATISSKTNRFATTREEHSSNNEEVLKITFTVKEVTSDTSTTVSLKNIELSNGAELDIPSITSSPITIKLPVTTPDNPDTPDTPDNPDNPSNPDTPDNPNTPDAPNDSDNSDIPDNPNNNTTVKPGTDNTVNNNTNTPNTNSVNNRTDNATNNRVNNTNSSRNNNTNRNTNNNNNNGGGTVVNSSNGSANSKLPATGINGYISILIIVVASIAIMIYIKMKRLDKRIEKEANSRYSDEDKDNK